MKKFLLFFVILFASTIHSQAMTGIFWQPQMRDLQISTEEWQSLMITLKKKGIDTLILQWTRHDDSFTNSNDEALLLDMVNIAHHVGLNIIIGLYADPKFFQKQHQSPEILSSYLRTLYEFDLQQVKHWQSLLKFQPAGWYISAEIDDLNWINPINHALLLIWLEHFKSDLTKLTKRPIYISSFFAGNVSPAEYSDLIHSIADLGIKVWVQDGSGVNFLNAKKRNEYLNASVACHKLSASGIIYELFQTMDNNQFSPKPKSINADLLQQKKTCGKDNIYFSLRYLNSIDNPLNY